MSQISKEELMNIMARDVTKVEEYLQESHAIRNYKKEFGIGFR